MKKTVFLLGAGASCEYLPLVKQMRERLGQTVELLTNNIKKASASGSTYWNGPDIKEQQLAHQFLIDDLTWLHKNSEGHASIDTFAKKLFLTDSPDYYRLKRCLVAFFFIEQICNPPDSRYDTFLASVLTKSLKFPENIKVISWNYDFQLEKAFAPYVHSDQIGTVSDNLSVAQKFLDGYIVDKSSIFKVNGTTYIKNRFGGVHLYAYFTPKGSTEQFIRDFSNSYYMTVSKTAIEMTLSFAWENDKFVNEVNKSIDQSKILVVIGYSFPFFNREVDRQLLNGIQFEKIYIQDRSPEQIWSKIKAIRPDLNESIVNHIHISPDGKDEFFLPHDL